MSESKKGIIPHNKNGKSNYQCWLEKYDKEIADEKQRIATEKFKISMAKRREKKNETIRN